ncbi:MAG: MATE family efflux transporter [Clostridiales bacterium]|nr:MATE family efflux transporter [Clostridiales bacterium]
MNANTTQEISYPTEKNQFAANLVANIIAFFVNFAISFFLTPFIIKYVGSEAYGFVNLGNNLINYVSIITLTLNSMASRFIALRIHKNDFAGANKYFSSVIISNVVLTLILIIPTTLIVLFFDKFINIEAALVPDIRLLWTLLFLNLFISIVTSAYSSAFFSANRIDLQSRNNIISYLLKGAVLVLCYLFFTAKTWYVGLAAFVSTVFVALYSVKYSRKLFPNIRFSKKDFDLKAIKELISSGVWNTVSRVGGLALNGLDLLISNVFISDSAMGTLAVANTVPNYVIAFNGTFSTVFIPQLTKIYAKGNIDEFVKEVKSSFRILLFFNSIIYGLLFSFSDVFYTLWLPTGSQNIELLYKISMLTIAGCAINAISVLMDNIFLVTNRLRFPSIAVIFAGITSITITFLALKLTSLGLYAVAGVSVFVIIIRNIVLLLPYGAKCLGKPWHTFFPDMLMNIGVVALAILIGFGIKNLLRLEATWLNLVLLCALTAVIIIAINFFLVLRKSDRQYILSKVQKVFKR